MRLTSYLILLAVTLGLFAGCAETLDALTPGPTKEMQEDRALSMARQQAEIELLAALTAQAKATPPNPYPVDTPEYWQFEQTTTQNRLLALQQLEFMRRRRVLTNDNREFTQVPQDSGLQPDGYGLGVHRNQYGQPVTVRPDFGGVPGEQLQIKENAFGPGIHMDQYGRPVREYSWPDGKPVQ
jgi:hypothetical protein